MLSEQSAGISLRRTAARLPLSRGWNSRGGFVRRTSPWKMHTTPTSRGNAGKVGRRPPSTMDQLRDAWSTICREGHVETVVDVNRASIRQRRRPSCLDVCYAIDRTRDSLERKLLQRIPLTTYAMYFYPTNLE